MDGIGDVLDAIGVLPWADELQGFAREGAVVKAGPFRADLIALEILDGAPGLHFHPLAGVALHDVGVGGADAVVAVNQDDVVGRAVNQGLDVGAFRAQVLLHAQHLVAGGFQLVNVLAHLLLLGQELLGAVLGLLQ